MYFPVNFVKFLRTPFFIEYLWWLLLSVAYKFLLLNYKNSEFAVYTSHFV